MTDHIKIPYTPQGCENCKTGKAEHQDQKTRRWLCQHCYDCINYFDKQLHRKGETKFDEGKPRIDLVPPELIFALAELFRKGASKHGERNWEQGLTASETFAAGMRHAWKWFMKRKSDKHTAMNHLVSAVWNLGNLFVCEVRGTLKDDRVDLSAKYKENDIEQLFRD